MARTSMALADTRIEPSRLLAAVLTVPLADALLGYLGFPLVWWLGNHGEFRPISPNESALMVGGLAGIAGLFVMVTAAVPVRSWLIRRGRRDLHHFALAGAVAGNLPFAAYLWGVLVFTLVHLANGTLAQHLSAPSDLIAGSLRVLTLGSILGTVSGMLFWTIAGPAD